MGDLTNTATAVQRIVIQGVRGAFHEIAARQYFGNRIEVVPALSFDELFEKAASPRQSDAAVIAIENSIAGSILGNYRLLIGSRLTVIGEVYLRIRQNLLALPGVDLKDLREVHSHPMALAQCSEFFKSHPHIRLVESQDTAESAAHIVRRRAKHIGAIASELAAEIYGLHVLRPAIETVPQNYTRFLVVRRSDEAHTVVDANKVSLCVTLPHRPGSLAALLNRLAASGADLTKIQSVPLMGRPWEYQFLIDFKTEPAQMATVIGQLEDLTVALQILGMYHDGGNTTQPPFPISNF
ncbi:MAG: prephenate dehydratase [Saprospiraceae bacterium]|nr:prephenate dehydratase [Saprospiraceae bacterium]